MVCRYCHGTGRVLCWACEREPATVTYKEWALCATCAATKPGEGFRELAMACALTDWDDPRISRPIASSRCGHILTDTAACALANGHLGAHR